jgi:hypothetical protein
VDLGKLLAGLKQERDRLNRAITALEGIHSASNSRPIAVVRTTTKRRRSITPEGQKRLSEMMKKKWAERRKKVAAIRKPVKQVA